MMYCSIGESKNLRELIRRDIPIDVYEQMLDYEFIVTVVNFSTAETRYFSNKAYDTRGYNCAGLERKALKECQTKKDSVYNEMINWIWASGNQPLFMSLLKTKIDTATRITNRGKTKSVVNKHFWVDGGIRENIAVLRGMQHILENGDPDETDTIDVIINNTRYPHMEPLEKPKVLKSLFRTISILTYDTRQNDLRIPGSCNESNQRNERDSKGNIVVNLYFMKEDTYHTHPKDLLFDIEGMTKLWNLGNNIEESAEMESCTIPKDDAKRLVEEARGKREVHP